MLTFKSNLICLALLTAIFAQTSLADDSPWIGGVSSPGGIYIGIEGNVLHESTTAGADGWIGYNIYRSHEKEDKFTKLTPDPLSRIGTLEELEVHLGVGIQRWIGTLGLENSQDLWESIITGNERILGWSRFDPKMRRALGLTFVDSTAEPGETYIYALSMVRSEGSESERIFSEPVTCGVLPYELLSPIDVTTDVSESRVRISWKTNKDNVATYSYSVYRSSTKGGSYLRINDRPIHIFQFDNSDEEATGMFTDTNIAVGKNYFYYVVTVDIAGNESEFKDCVVAKPTDITPPDAPLNIEAKASLLGITVSWDAVTDRKLAGYLIYRSEGMDSAYSQICESLIGPEVRLYEDRSVKPDHEYFYKITAIDEAGNESDSSKMAQVVYENFRPPLPPHGLTAEEYYDSVLISWDPNTEIDLGGYYVYRAERLDGDLALVSHLISSDTTFFWDNDNRLSHKGSYWYILQAVNSTGVVSNFSAPIVARPLTNEEPESPISFYGYSDIAGNHLIWEIPSDNTIGGYLVQRKRSENVGEWTVINQTPIPASAYAYVDSTAEWGLEYQYRITGVSGFGVEGQPSHTVKLTRFETTPPTPSGVRVSKVDGGLMITWNANQCSRIAGFRVYRRTDSGERIAISKSILPQSTTAYTDKNAEETEINYYSVSTVNYSGTESELSDEVEF